MGERSLEHSAYALPSTSSTSLPATSSGAPALGITNAVSGSAVGGNTALVNGGAPTLAPAPAAPTGGTSTTTLTPTGGGSGGGVRHTAASKKVFVGGLSWETDERSLREYFGRWGTVSDCVIMRDRHTGHPRGFGFVTYEEESAAALVAAARHELDGRQVEAKRAVPRSECAPALRSGGTRATKKVFVGGLPATCGQEHFAEYFARFGAVADAQVMYDHHTGNSRGFGFVTFVDECTVDLVCDHDAHDIMGKFVDVKRAEPRQVLDARRNAAAAAAATPMRTTPANPNPAAPVAGNVWSTGVGNSIPGPGVGTLECAALYAPDVAHAVHRNLYAAACPAEHMSMHARPVAAARVERRYHPYASRERRVLRSYW